MLGVLNGPYIPNCFKYFNELKDLNLLIEPNDHNRPNDLNA